MEKSYVNEEEVKENFKENNKEILGINDEEKLKKALEEKELLLKQKDSYMKRFKKITGVYVV